MLAHRVGFGFQCEIPGGIIITDSGIVMVDGTFFGDSFEQDRPWDDSGTTI